MLLYFPPTTAFSLLVLTERPHPTRLFLKKSRTSLPCPVQSRSENALKCMASINRYTVPIGVLYAKKMMARTDPRGGYQATDIPTATDG